MTKSLLLLTTILFSSSVFSFSLNQQRAIYSEAQSLQTQQRWKEADKKLASIPRYPLTYILEYNKLKANFSRESVAQISDFIERNKTRKLTDSLQREYMYYLAKHKFWREFITFYPQLPSTKKLKCFYFQAKISQGDAQSIWDDVEDVWLTGSSQPSVCDPVFDYYKKQNMISEKLIWQRFKLAANSNEKSVMKYLISLMGSSKKKLAEQVYAVNIAPQKLPNSSLFLVQTNASYPFLISSLKRLARVDIDLAVQTYQDFDKKLPFSSSDKTELNKYFIYRILIHDELQLLPWLDKTLSALGDVKLIEQRIRFAIRYNNWADIEYWLSQLPEDIAQGNTWVYWKARVLEEGDNIKAANKLYKEIAGERKYYSFLAAQKLGLPYQLEADIVEPNVSIISHLEARLDHIEELYFHQYILLVKREWVALLEGRDLDIQRQLGLYANDKGWSHLSVVASIRSKSWSAINIRFPEVDVKLFAKNSLKYQIPSTYLYAITRQESAFDQHANSPVGATGYMQLMPATAKETARKIGLSNYKGKAQLTDVKINVELGSAYFNGLLQRYDGNRILATAAYNAGPHRVDRWKKNMKGRSTDALGMDSWIEAIPYKETRRYVKNVLAYNVIYQHVLQKPVVFFNDIELQAKY